MGPIFFLFFLKKDFYLLQRHSDKEGERKGKRIFDFLVHFLNGHSGQDWSQVKARSLEVPLGVPALGPSPAAFSSAITRGWVGSAAAGTPWHAGVAAGGLTPLCCSAWPFHGKVGVLGGQLHSLGWGLPLLPGSLLICPLSVPADCVLVPRSVVLVNTFLAGSRVSFLVSGDGACCTCSPAPTGQC